MTHVVTRLSRQPGRFVLSARDQLLIADASLARGGSAQAWSAQELLLAGLQTCALAVIEDEARQAQFGLLDVQIDGQLQIDEERPGHYQWIRLALHLIGVTQAQAEQLVAHFTTVCPIYGSLSRGAAVSVQVTSALSGDPPR